MKNVVLFTILISSFTLSCKTHQDKSYIYTSGTLSIEQITPDIFIHITSLAIPDYGAFPCNGMIYKSGSQAIIFDTPTMDSVSLELIRWVNDVLNCDVVGIVINHFHTDCLGGLGVFKEHDIPVYANHLTFQLSGLDASESANIEFDMIQEIPIGRKKVINRFFGEGHTRDNIVSYIPDENVLFGGCMIKELGAGKGNLEDANILAWAETVNEIKLEYPQLRIVIPGHGEAGNIELLDYTIEMFDHD